jgi:hypothetical protein
MEQLMIVKELGVQFNKFRKISSTNSIPTDEILSQLERKLEKDTNVCGPMKFLINDITETTKRITENEQHINNSVNYLKEKQDELAAYLVKFNSINTGQESFNQQGISNNFLITE